MQPIRKVYNLEGRLRHLKPHLKSLDFTMNKYYNASGSYLHQAPLADPSFDK
jgi:hypothetical protein